MNDRPGAFVTDREAFIQGSASGPLSGLTFGAKDVFDIATYRTGFGNPDWLNSHPPATTTASAVQRVLEAGATLVGKTHTDEMTFSLNGENFHYGTPENPNAPGRVPGGSSSGSASAVAGKLVDFALGTDTGGSVRLPASNCGIYGLRPTHGMVPNDHVLPLAPAFDTVGWFARDATMLERVGKVLLAEKSANAKLSRFMLATDAFDLVFEQVRPALEPAIDAIAAVLGAPETVFVYAGQSREWVDAFRILQGVEIWEIYGEWIRKINPVLGPVTQKRFDWAASLDPKDVPSANAVRTRASRRLEKLIGQDGVLCIPSSPSIALPLNSPDRELEDFRSRALTLLCIAGLGGLPQVSIPLASYADCPLGISLIGPRNSDAGILALASEIAGQT